MKNFGNFINESSLSRVWSHNEAHECAALTAFRKSRDCGNGEAYTAKENAQRNKSLLAKLKVKGYGVTSLKGMYPEGGKVSKEESFFVVNLNDDKDFFSIIAKLGEEFEQDSILLIPKNAISNTGEKAYLYGTNHCENNWLGYHKKEIFEKGKLGHASPIYTSYVNGKPFIFEEIGNQIADPCNGMGVMMMHRVAEKDWNLIDV